MMSCAERRFCENKSCVFFLSSGVVPLKSSIIITITIAIRITIGLGIRIRITHISVEPEDNFAFYEHKCNPLRHLKATKLTFLIKFQVME